MASNRKLRNKVRSLEQELGTVTNALSVVTSTLGTLTSTFKTVKNLLDQNRANKGNQKHGPEAQILGSRIPKEEKIVEIEIADNKEEVEVIDISDEEAKVVNKEYVDVKVAHHMRDTGIKVAHHMKDFGIEDANDLNHLDIEVADGNEDGEMQVVDHTSGDRAISTSEPASKAQSHTGLSQVIREKCGSRVLTLRLTRCQLTETGKKRKLRIRPAKTSGKHKCKSCGLLCPHKSKLVIHERIHAGERPFECMSCHRSFSRKSILTKHMRTHTVEVERRYTCTYCDQGFSRKTVLKRHTKTHTGERRYSCLYCDRSYSREQTLTDHMGVHTGERPNKCKFCGETFIWFSALTSHISKKHK